MPVNLSWLDNWVRQCDWAISYFGMCKRTWAHSQYIFPVIYRPTCCHLSSWCVSASPVTSLSKQNRAFCQAFWKRLEEKKRKKKRELIENNNYNYWLIVQSTWRINFKLYGKLWIAAHSWCKEWLNSSVRCGGCCGRNTHSGERLAINNISSRLLSQVQTMNNTFPSHSTYIIPTHSPPPSRCYILF